MQRLIANLETMGITFPQGIQQTFLSIEKEQIMTANIEGTEHGYKERTVFGLDARPYSKKRAEQYYNETYNQNES